MGRTSAVFLNFEPPTTDRERILNFPPLCGLEFMANQKNCNAKWIGIIRNREGFGFEGTNWFWALFGFGVFSTFNSQRSFLFFFFFFRSKYLEKHFGRGHV